MRNRTLSPEPLAATDHEHVLKLFHHAPLQHLHLDWQRLDEWLPRPDLHCWVRRENGLVSSLLGATRHPPGNAAGVAWLRMMLPDSPVVRETMFDGLWKALCADLLASGIEQVAMLAIDAWVEVLAKRWNFKRTNAVITLRRLRGQMPPAPGPPLLIRGATYADFGEIVQVDAAAFPPLWQYSLAILEAASRHAATFTVLESEGFLLGYQLSTEYVTNGHLARLAILPQSQGRGLGGMLIGDMLRFFQARNINTVTVNTQEDNLRSQRLYKRLGFEVAGHAIPVWTVML